MTSEQIRDALEEFCRKVHNSVIPCSYHKPMAISIGTTNFNQMAAEQQARLQPPPSPLPDLSKPGNLVVVDSFMPGMGLFGASPEPAHGAVVAQAARHQGFRGPIIAREAGGGADPRLISINAQLNEPGLSPERTRDLLKQQVRLTVVDSYRTYENHFRELEGAGLNGSAVNLSMGMSPAKMTQTMDDELEWSRNAPNNEFIKNRWPNTVRAFGLDEAKLGSDDPKVSGPERARLQKALAELNIEVMHQDPTVASARQSYDASISSLEARNNSVVVSAGNWGEAQSELKKTANGYGFEAPKNFGDNLFANRETTNVGATRWLRGSEGLSQKVASYSNGEEVDIYASGSVGLQDPQKMSDMGTSFAAPRVAVAMAELHKTHPGLSSSQVESLMKKKLTSQLPDYGGAPQLPVLDQQLTSEYLRTNVF